VVGESVVGAAVVGATVVGAAVVGAAVAGAARTGCERRVHGKSSSSPRIIRVATTNRGLYRRPWGCLCFQISKTVGGHSLRYEGVGAVLKGKAKRQSKKPCM